MTIETFWGNQTYISILVIELYSLQLRKYDSAEDALDNAISILVIELYSLQPCFLVPRILSKLQYFNTRNRALFFATTIKRRFRSHRNNNFNTRNRALFFATFTNKELSNYLKTKFQYS